MDMSLKEDFIRLWQKYFNDADLPLAFYFTDEEGHAEAAKAGTDPPPGVFNEATIKLWSARCLIGQLTRVRRGSSLYFSRETLGCAGGKMHLGFSENEPMPNFEYFISHGIPGKIEGERYKKSPDLVKEAMARYPKFQAPARFIVFKRWDKLEASDNPEVVLFYAKPDVLAALVTLANFDRPGMDAVIDLWTSGCGSIVRYPYVEKDSVDPHAVIGMFDPSARPWVGPDELTFAIPMKKFINMVRDMEESFLITPTWEMVKKRIN